MSLWINQNLKNIKKYVNLKIWKANNNLRYNLIKFNILKKKNIIQIKKKITKQIKKKNRSHNKLIKNNVKIIEKNRSPNISIKNCQKITMKNVSLNKSIKNYQKILVMNISHDKSIKNYQKILVKNRITNKIKKYQKINKNIMKNNKYKILKMTMDNYIHIKIKKQLNKDRHMMKRMKI